MNNEGKIDVVFWNFRALVDPILHMLEYAGLPYNLYSVKSLSEWNVQKSFLISQEVEFPNLPFIHHNGKYLSETLAIAAYISGLSTVPLYSFDSSNITFFFQLQGMILDIKDSLTGVCYVLNSEESLESLFRETVKMHSCKIASMDHALSKRKWLMHDTRLNILDFFLAYLIEVLFTMDKEVGNGTLGSKYEHFSRFIEDFHSLEAIKKYRSSDRFVIRPFFSEFARWK